MHNEAFTRAVLAERARERDLAMRHRQLLAPEPELEPAPRPVRARFLRMPRRLRLRRAGAYLT
jgi:hypothetical protein